MPSEVDKPPKGLFTPWFCTTSYLLVQKSPGMGHFYAVIYSDIDKDFCWFATLKVVNRLDITATSESEKLYFRQKSRGDWKSQQSQ